MNGGMDVGDVNSVGYVRVEEIRDKATSFKSSRFCRQGGTLR